MRQFPGRKRWAAALAAALALLPGVSCIPAPPPPAQVVFLCPANTPASWERFARAAEKAGLAAGLKCRRADGDDVLRFDSAPPLELRCARALGHLHMRRVVKELCAAEPPPAALIGGGNSGLAQAIAAELKLRGDDGPALLLTYASLDSLTAALPGRTFRFCRANTRQAEAVVARLKAWLEQRKFAPHTARVAIAKVADNPFANDLAAALRRELAAGLSLPASAFAHAAADFGVLPTETGSYDEPTDQESAFARTVAAEVVACAPEPYILALATGAKVHRRLSIALHKALEQDYPREKLLDAKQRLTLIAGDSLDVEDFRNPVAGGLAPRQAMAASIFFAPDGMEPNAGGLDLEIAAALLGAWQVAGKTGQPFKAALAEHRLPGEAGPMFAAGERRDGGGTVVATPKGDAFELAYAKHAPR